jgi:hypothetical protein
MKKSKMNDLALLTGEGMAVFPLARNTRIPLKGSHGFKDATTDIKKAREMFKANPDANIGVATGPVSGVVVLDVDVKKGKPGKKSLAKLETKVGSLAKTTIVRTTTGGQHNWFRYPGMDIRDSTETLAPGLDIRGDGGYVVAPHSTIDGKKYEWVNDLIRLKPLPDDLHELILKVKKGRNRLPEHTSSDEQKANDPALLRAALVYVKNDDVTYEDWIYMGHALKAALGQDEGRADWLAWSAQSDKYDEAETVKEWDKYLKPPHKAGAGSIFFWAKEAGWVRPKSDTSAAGVAVQELNKRLGFIMLKGKATIVGISEDPKYHGTSQISLSRQQDVAAQYANDTVGITVDTADGEKTKQINKFSVWMKSPDRRAFRQLILRPDLPSGFDPATADYNMWQGFGVKAVKPDKKHSWRKLQDHIEIFVANGNERYADYIFGWLAFCVQHPEQKPGVVLALQGGEGVGKGTVLRAMLKLFGRHGLHLHKQEQLTGKHNEHLKDVLFIFADEAYFAGDKSATGTLNALVTEDEYFIEPKFVDGFSLDNRRKIAMASNEAWVVPAGIDARRYAIFKVSEKQKDKLKYFAAIAYELEHGGYEAMLWDLQHYNISKFNPKRYTQTAALFEQKKLNWDETTQWYFDRLLDQHSWITSISSAKLFTIISGRTKSPWDQRQLRIRIGIALRKVCPSMEKGQPRSEGRSRVYKFPSLEIARAAFAKAHRTTSEHIDWGTGEFKEDVP